MAADGAGGSVTDVNSKSTVREEEQLGYTQDNDHILEVEKEAEPGEKYR